MSAERRKHPRFSKRLAVRVGNLDLHTTNVSASGLQLSIPISALSRLKQVLRNDRFEATVLLPDSRMLGMTGQVTYISDAGDEFLCGVRIEQFQAGAESAWTEYAASSTGPAAH